MFIPKQNQLSACIFSAVIVLAFSLGCGDSGNIAGKYTAGFFYADFKEDGTVRFYQAESISATNISCNTRGSWSMNGGVISISGLSNPNCPSVSEWNRTVGIDGLRLYFKESSSPTASTSTNTQLTSVQLSERLDAISSGIDANCNPLAVPIPGDALHSNNTFLVTRDSIYFGQSALKYTKVLFVSDELCVYTHPVEVFDRWEDATSILFCNGTSEMLYHPDSSHISESVKLENIDGEYALTGSDFELFLPPRSEVRHKYELWYWPSEKHRSGRDLAIEKLKGRTSAFDGFKYIGRGQMNAYKIKQLWKNNLSIEQNLLAYGPNATSEQITRLKDGSAQLVYESKSILVDNVAYNLKGTTFGYKDYGNGSYYEGELFNDKPDGKGLMVRSNNDEYQGDWEDGKYHGQGTYKFANGSTYSGDWVNGTREGKGEFLDVRGWRYVGDWKNDTKEGDGEMHFSVDLSFRSGTRYQAGTWYSGKWSDGVMEGYGTIYGPDSVVIETGMYANSLLIRGRKVTTDWTHNGDFENGKASGEGTRTWSSGGQYTGNWKSGQQHGAGTEIYASGARCQGTWVNGKLDGYCTWVTSDGDSYEGNMRDNQYEGYGTWKWVNGGSYSGNWVKSKMSGEGLFTSKDGWTFQGVWANGVATGVQRNKEGKPSKGVEGQLDEYFNFTSNKELRKQKSK